MNVKSYLVNPEICAKGVCDLNPPPEDRINPYLPGEDRFVARTRTLIDQFIQNRHAKASASGVGLRFSPFTHFLRSPRQPTRLTTCRLVTAPEECAGAFILGWGAEEAQFTQQNASATGINENRENYFEGKHILLRGRNRKPIQINYL